MTGEDTVAVLRQWGILIGVICTAIVSIINALKTKEAAEKADVKTNAVIDRLGSQDNVLASTSEKVDQYHYAVNSALTASTEAARAGAEKALREQVVTSTDAATALLVADLQKRLAVAEQRAKDAEKPPTTKVENRQ